MNPGAHLIAPSFPEFETAQKVLSEVTESEWVPTVPDGPYQNEGWRVVKIVAKGKRTQFAEQHPEIGRVLDYFKDPIEMAVFYSMLPGTILHPHRDLSGTLELGKIRYHVPLATNSDVKFFVDKKRVPMANGEMWALNTSYLHAVENASQIDRVHLVVEVEVGKWSWSLLPRKNLRYYGHYAWFMSLVMWRGFTKLVTQKDALKTYSNMSRTFMRRLLRRKPA
jgi:hypothetical protein